jgi:UMF1 family MFS transporter
MRALMAAIAPPERVSACFGLYAFVGKATNFAGPLILALVVDATGSLRLGLAVAALFLVAGIACFAAMPAGQEGGGAKAA